MIVIIFYIVLGTISLDEFVKARSLKREWTEFQVIPTIRHYGGEEELIEEIKTSNEVERNPGSYGVLEVK